MEKANAVTLKPKLLVTEQAQVVMASSIVHTTVLSVRTGKAIETSSMQNSTTPRT